MYPFLFHYMTHTNIPRVSSGSQNSSTSKPQKSSPSCNLMVNSERTSSRPTQTSPHPTGQSHSTLCCTSSKISPSHTPTLLLSRPTKPVISQSIPTYSTNTIHGSLRNIDPIMHVIYFSGLMDTTSALLQTQRETRMLVRL